MTNQPTRCDDYEILMERNLANALPEEDVVFLAAHTANCASCTEYLRSASATSATLRTVTVQVPSPQRRAALEQKLRARRRVFGFDLGSIVLALLCGLLTVGVYWWFDYPFVAEMIAFGVVVTPVAAYLWYRQDTANLNALVKMASTTGDLLAAHREHVIRNRREQSQASAFMLVTAIGSVVLAVAARNEGAMMSAIMLTSAVTSLATGLYWRLRVEPRLVREIADLGGAS